jgi:DNA mismatch repair protein MSH5
MEMSRTVINPGVNEDLDEKKRLYDGMESLLNEISQEIAATIPPHFDLDLNVVFFPQIGFLICTPMDPQTGKAEYEGEEGSEWERIFSTENRIYFKDHHMKELDENIGDVYGWICGESNKNFHNCDSRCAELEDRQGD